MDDDQAMKLYKVSLTCPRVLISDQKASEIKMLLLDVFSHQSSEYQPTGVASNVRPVNVGSSSSLPPRAPKPPISEARRKVRDLLCKTKNDPRYFDD